MKKKLPIQQLFHSRDSRLLLTGQAISTFGDGVALVAFTLLVLDTTHSAVDLGWFAAARSIPMIAFLLFGGVVVDRFSRKRLLLLSDVVRAAVTGLLTVLLLFHAVHFWELLAVAVVFGSFDSLFVPAVTAMIPEVVDEDLLPAMNAVRSFSFNVIGNMLGPAVGGLIAAFSTSWSIGLDCATFLVSAATLVMMRPTPVPTKNEANNMLKEIRDGFTYVRSTPWFWYTCLAVVGLNAFVFMPVSVLIPFFLRHTLHDSKQVVGYFFAVGGLSGGLGALIVSLVKMPRRRVRRMWTYWLIGDLGGLLIAVATNFWPIFLSAIIGSATMSLGGVVWESLMQSEVPRELMGRASSVDWFISLGLSPVGLVVASTVASHIGVRAYYGWASVFFAIPSVMILLSKKANQVDANR